MLQVPFATSETRSKLGWVNFRKDFQDCYYRDREKNWPMADWLAWENSQHFATPSLAFLWNDIWETGTEIPYWWRITTQIWVVMRHQYGISVLVSQTSFGGETSGSIAKCRLFSQATDWHVSSDEKWWMSMSVYVWATWPCKWISSSAIENQQLILWVCESVLRESIFLRVTLWFCPSFTFLCVHCM